LISPAGHQPPDWKRASPRRRATAIGLTIAAELLFLLILLGLNPNLPSKILTPPTVITLDLSPDPPATQSRARQPTPKARPQAQPQAARPMPQPPRAKLPTPPPLPLIPLSKAEMAAADISNLGSRAPGAGASSNGSQTAATGPGEGPGGAHLYNAEWVREPTDGELASYLPKDGVDRGSWAQIACKTVERYHVEDCRLLGESPPGSGLARAMRLASWQFLVRPPRIDGKPLVGSWVRIRIEFNEKASG
jgi:protein TonB